MDTLLQMKLVGKVGLAMLLGGIIGIEREFYKKPAGFRTLMLVSGAAALMMLTYGMLLELPPVRENTLLIRMDPLRIIQAIITGVSFLGAGTIIRRRESEQVEGLTTAAAILLASTVGICVGLNYYMLALGISCLSLLVISGMRVIDRWIAKRRET